MPADAFAFGECVDVGTLSSGEEIARLRRRVHPRPPPVFLTEVPEQRGAGSGAALAYDFDARWD